MPIHSIDEKPIIRVETNVGGKIVDLEATDYREQEYKRNQQTEPRRKYVMEPLPGTEPEPTPITDDTPVEMSDDLQAAINEDLRKRGVSIKPKEIKIQKPKPKTTLD